MYYYAKKRLNTSSRSLRTLRTGAHKFHTIIEAYWTSTRNYYWYKSLWLFNACSVLALCVCECLRASATSRSSIFVYIVFFFPISWGIEENGNERLFDIKCISIPVKRFIDMYLYIFVWQIELEIVIVEMLQWVEQAWTSIIFWLKLL